MIRDLIDSIIGPASDFLEYAIVKIHSISLVAERGLNLDYFLGPISMLGPAWVALITSIVLSLLLIGVVFIAKSAYNIYLNFKEGVKWW